MMTDCLFCKIIEGKIPAKKLMESADAIAIEDIHPQAPLHALLIPKKHFDSLNALNEKTRREVLPGLYDLADKLASEKGIRERGYRVVINNQTEGGQSVFHLHAHVLGGAPLRAHVGQ